MHIYMVKQKQAKVKEKELDLELFKTHVRQSFFIALNKRNPKKRNILSEAIAR